MGHFLAIQGVGSKRFTEDRSVHRGMVTRRDLVKLGMAVAASAGCAPVARAGTGLLTDIDPGVSDDQQLNQSKSNSAANDNWRPYVEIIGADPYPGPSPPRQT